MVAELVNDYWLNYQPSTQTVRSWVQTAAGGRQTVNDIPAEEAVFTSDPLRSEEPVFWVTGNPKLDTKDEPPGESE